MRTEVTDNYIIFGSGGRQFEHTESKTRGTRNNQLLDPESGNNSETWDFRSPHFGLKDSPSLGAIAMKEVCKSYSPGKQHTLATPAIEKYKEHLKEESNDNTNATTELANIIRANQAKKSTD